MFKVGILTVSDKASVGSREDESGPIIKQMISGMDGRVEVYQIVPDDKGIIVTQLRHMSDRLKLDLVLTTGGTGFSSRDVTPEATSEVIEKEVPGFGEVMRAEGMKKTPVAMLSRAISGIRGQTLIINLPGSPQGVKESLEAILPGLRHGLEILKGQAGECSRRSAR